MHPSIAGVLKTFDYTHLPEGPIREASFRFYTHANQLATELPSSADLTFALRTLWEAKNAAVYAVAAYEKEKQARESDDA